MTAPTADERAELEALPCVVPNCTQPRTKHSVYCGRHAVDPDPQVRFWPRVQKTETCWLWTGSLTPLGYGTLHADGRKVRVHRFAFELLRAPIPAGMVLDHICRVRNCVNPDHLEPVTGKVNTLRGISFAAIHARQTHCIHGHEFTPANTYRRRNTRACRTCRRAAVKRYADRRRAQKGEAA